MKNLFKLIKLLGVISLPASAAIPPYLPESAPPQPYVTTTITPEQIAVTTADGKKITSAAIATVKSLNGQWKFSGIENSSQPFAEDADLSKGFAQKDFNDSHWDNIAVPLNWYAKYKKAQNQSLAFTKGWYRNSIILTEKEIAEKRVLLHFGVIGYSARLFVNGQEAGQHHGDFTPWDIDISKFVKPGDNSLAIRVFSDFGSAYGATKNVTHVYGSQWSIGSIKAGIWQNVELRLVEPVRLQRILINPDLAADTIKIDYRIINESGREQSCTLDGIVSSAMKNYPNRINTAVSLGNIKLQPGETAGHAEIKLNQPVKWSLSQPHLYYLTLALRRQDAIITATPVRFGFRDFKAKGNKFYLNGEQIYLFGENFPSSRYEGNGASAEQAIAILAEQLTGYKSVGCNIVRTAHAPTSPALYRIADEIGLMIYAEWGWSFNKEIDEPVFERNNLEELADWVYRDYNHPCVVMWSCGNEVVYKNSEAVKRQLDKQVALVRSLDKSGRPVGSFSGSGLWTHYGSTKLNTELIDLHHYLGLCAPAWTCWNDEFNRYYQGTVETYAENGKFNMPYIVWECVGFSWGNTPNPEFKTNDINSYAEYANRKTSWGEPNGIGFAGSIGLAAALDPKRGTDYGKEVYGQRVLETIRQDARIQGFAPWFHGSKLKMAKVWNQPVLCGLRDEAFVPLRNVFAGKTYRQTLFVVNSTGNIYDQPSAIISLVQPDGTEVPVKTIAIAAIKPWDIANQTIEFAIPAMPKPLHGQLRVTLKNGDREISRNFYPLFIQSPAVLNQPVKSEKNVALLQNGNVKGLTGITAILDVLSIKYKTILPGSALKGIDLLIIPPALADDPKSLLDREPLLTMVQQGGIVLQMEQNAGASSIIESSELTGESNTFVDLAIPGHPVFAGLNQENFDTWNNPDHGFIIKTVLTPFTINALAVQGPLLGRRNVGNAVVEASLGKGRIFCSQLEATGLWGIDSAATTYVRNLLTYLAGNTPVYGGITPLSLSRNRDYTAVKENLVPIDIKAYANRSFTDDVAEDGKGGWTDQGLNDFRMMPLGKQTAAGIVFEIIDPATNNDKSCLILRGNARPKFPATITGIKVGQKFSRLFFLHACAWGKGQDAGTYRIRYADGTHSDYTLEEGRNIGDWWLSSALSEARLGIVRSNRDNHEVSLFVAAWENPFPGKEIAAIDFLSAGSGTQIDYVPGQSAVPILVAVTGEKMHPVPLKVSTDFKPTATAKDGDKPQINAKNPAAVTFSMPSPKSGSIPALMTKFPLDKFNDGNYHYLTFRIKAETTPVVLDFALPEKDWKSIRRATVILDARFRQWTKVRINLSSDMRLQGKEFPNSALRGELFIYNGSERKNETARPPVTFQLDSMTLE